MIDKNIVKKMVAGIMRGRKNASYDRHIMHPEREWFTLVFLGLVVFVIGVGWNIVTDMKFKTISVSYDSEEEEPVVYRESLVETALTDFAIRKAEYGSLKASLMSRGAVTQSASTSEPVTPAEVSPETTAPRVEVSDAAAEPISEPGVPEPEAPQEFDSTEVTFE